MKKILFAIFLLSGLLLSVPVLAQYAPVEAVGEVSAADAASVDSSEKIFTGQVKEILEEKTVTREDGSTVKQQNVRITGLDRGFEKQEVVADGIGDIDMMETHAVSAGDKVIVQETTKVDGTKFYVITDFVRTGTLFWLFVLFCISLLALGKWKGLKSLISLFVSFLIFLKVMLPMIIAGWNPLTTSVFCSVLILGAIIYITWGWNKKAHLATVSIFLSLAFTGAISILFSRLASLSGIQEDATFLIGMLNHTVDFKGLLLAGIIIGTLGVLDDVVVAQISAVEQMSDLDRHLSWRDLYKRGIAVGIDHISSMTNTLFLAYAGAAVPLMLLFAVTENASFSQIVNNELIATEIVRTLCGSLGLILAVPLSTIIAAIAYQRKIS
jgi:uncharacterized membrane protein